jgi:hypothetical protein
MRKWYKGDAMTAAEAGTREGTEIERIERWRAEALERAGYEPRIAAELAARLDIDLHLASDLLARGCSQELALQILV